ncbi:MAG: hypothetical protein ABIT37_10625 [Luteolibacter sp.]
MKNDSGGNPRNARTSKRLSANSFFYGWDVHLCIGLLCLYLGGPLTAADYTQQVGGNAPANVAIRLGNPVTFKWLAGTTVYCDLQGTGNYTSIGSTGSYTIYGPMTINTITGPITQTFTGGNVSQSAPYPVVQWTAAPVSITRRYKWASSTAAPIDVSIDCPVATCDVSYLVNSGYSFVFNRAAQVFNLTGTGPTENRGELILALMNKTGAKMLMGWGNKMLELAPGMNLIRYDGLLDEAGLPKVRPGDFSGTLINAPDGHNYLVGVIQPSTTNPGGFVWAAPPPNPYPTAPSGGIDQVRFYDGPPGPIIGFLHSGGGSDMNLLPTIQPASPSNTTGSNGTISDPTLPKPPQTVDNSVSNTTNNTTTNNTSVHNSTVINNNYTAEEKPAVPGNEGGANGLSSPDTSGDTGDSAGTPGGDTVGALGSARGAVQSAFGANSFKLLAEGTIPTVSVYPFDLNLGSWGSYHRDVNFSATPFPQFRMACLVVMTLGLGVSLMKRLTI